MSKTKRKKYSAAKRKQNTIFIALISVGALVVIAAIFLAGRGSQDASRTNLPIEVSGAPGLRVDQEFIDFGNVPVGQYVEKTFVVSNVGDQTLQFTNAPYVEVVEGC